MALLIMIALSTATAHAGVGIDIGGNWDMGTVSETGTYESRSINSLSARGFLGYRLAWFMPAVMAEYAGIGQVTDPVAVSNTNVMGQAYAVGAGGLIAAGPLKLGGAYEFYGKYSLDKTTAANEKVSYTKPLGWRAILGWQLMPYLYVDAFYQQQQWGEKNIGVTTTVLTQKLVRNTYGLGLSISY
jgi:opacity protein-like surface antigen